MPVYNAEAFVASAIRSILAQTFPNFELIVVNDGSTDDSGRIIADFASSDSRVVAIDQDNAGIVATVNRASGLARALLLARIDADDIALPRRLELQYAAFANRPDLAALGGHARLIDEGGRPTGYSLVPVGRRQIARAVRSESPIINPTLMMRRSVFEQIGGYDSRYEPAEDYDFWIRCVDAGYELDNLNRVLLRYRVHAQNISRERRATQALRTILARSFSAMRRDGVPVPARNEADDDVAVLRNLPEPFGPSEAEILEAMAGRAELLPATDIRLMLDELDRHGVNPRHRRAAARLQLRAGSALLAAGCGKDGLRTIVAAIRAHPFVVPEQVLRMLGRRWVRFARSLRYRAGAVVRVATGRD